MRLDISDDGLLIKGVSFFVVIKVRWGTSCSWNKENQRLSYDILVSVGYVFFKMSFHIQLGITVSYLNGGLFMYDSYWQTNSRSKF